MWHIIRFELKNVIADRTLPVVSGLLILLIAFALYNGQQTVNEKRATLAQVRAEESAYFTGLRARLDSVANGQRTVEWYEDPTNPLVLMAGMRGAGKYTYLLPADYALISVGQSDVYPYYAKVSVMAKTANQGTVSFENPFNLSNGQFDLAFVLVFLFPLMIIAFTYNVISAEREQGTLKLIAAQPLSLARLVLTRLLVRYLLVTGITLLVTAIALMLIGVPVGTADFARFALVFALYSLFWFIVAYFINLLGAASATNALLLIAAWLLTVFIIPSTVNMIAGGLHPVPSRVELVNAYRDAELGVDRRKETLLTQFYRQNPQFTRKPQAQQEWMEYYREYLFLGAEKEKRKAAIDAQFDQQLVAQQAVANRYRYFSPAVLFQESLNAIAGTSTEHFQAFQVATDAFYHRWRQYFLAKFDDNKKLASTDYATFPAYSPIRSGTGSPVAGNAVGILVFCGVFAGLSYGLVRRAPIAVS